MAIVKEGSQFFGTFEAFCSKALCIRFPGLTLERELGFPHDHPHEIARSHKTWELECETETFSADEKWLDC